MKIVVAVTGASGSIYAKRLLHHLQASDCVAQIAAVFSRNAMDIYRSEAGGDFVPDIKTKVYGSGDFGAPFASGSCSFDAMAICPCSMGTLGRVASGTSDSLIARAADVMLKERRRLVMVLREAPYSLIHIRNMETVTLAGGIICPASPSFYSNPRSIEQLADTVVFRVLALLGIPNPGFRWGENP